jgi:hypothetical protein
MSQVELILRGNCDSVLNTHAPTEDECDYTEDNFYENC